MACEESACRQVTSYILSSIYYCTAFGSSANLFGEDMLTQKGDRLRYPRGAFGTSDMKSQSSDDWNGEQHDHNSE